VARAGARAGGEAGIFFGDPIFTGGAFVYAMGTLVLPGGTDAARRMRSRPAGRIADRGMERTGACARSLRVCAKAKESGEARCVGSCGGENPRIAG